MNTTHSAIDVLRHARDPKVYLLGGDTVPTEIEGHGSCANKIVKA